jgi:hypothetical protein
MSQIKVGDIIRIKDREDWPQPPGYMLAGSEGDVTSISEEEGFVTMHLRSTRSNITPGTTLAFRLENVDKI